MAQYDDLNTKQIWIVGAISAVLTGITILAVQVLFYAMQGSHDASMSSAEYTSSVEAIDAQLREIDSYGYNEETKAYEIPINKAMDKMIQSSKEESPEA